MEKDETLTGFVFRLGEAAKQIDGLPDEGHKLMVRSKVISSMSEESLGKLKVQIAPIVGVTLEQILTILKAMEQQQ